MDILLHETQLKHFVTSGITNKSIQKEGTGDVDLKRALLNYPSSLHLVYEVDSSKGGATIFTANGQELAGLNRGYTVQLYFENIKNIMPNNFTSLPYSQQAAILQRVFDKADVKVQCDCGSFYWQGMSEKDSDKGNTRPPFSGHPGKDIWASRHNASGNVQGQQLCKHLWAAVEHIDGDIPNIVKSLSGTKATTSAATATTQPTDALEAPDQPAGLPDERVKSKGGIKSDKAADAVQADIDEVQSRSEQNDLPTLDTTETEAKPVEEETEAQEGPEDAEPPIEEPNVSKSLEPELEKEEDDLLEEPLDTKSKPVGLVESFENIYSNSLKEMIALPILRTGGYYDDIELEADNDDADEIREKLNNIIIPAKKCLSSIGVDDDYYASELISMLGKSKNDKSFVIIDTDMNPVGFSIFKVRGKKKIKDILVISFLDTNNMSIAKHIIEKVEEFRKKGFELVWDVFLDNPIKRAYDRFVDKLGGESWDEYLHEVDRPVRRYKLSPLTERLQEILEYVGDCTDDNYAGYRDETCMAQDLGYYSTFNEDSDGKEKDSNFSKISEKEFIKMCPDFKKVIGQNEWLFLKRFDDTVYCAYNYDDDIHYFWAD